MSHAASQLSAWGSSDELTHVRRLRALVALLSLYAGALVAVIVLSDGSDVGCVLVAIFGHVVYVACRSVTSWRDASWLERARRPRDRRRTTGNGARVVKAHGAHAPTAALQTTR